MHVGHPSACPPVRPSTGHSSKVCCCDPDGRRYRSIAARHTAARRAAEECHVVSYVRLMCLRDPLGVIVTYRIFFNFQGIFYSRALLRQVLLHRAKFCGGRSYRFRGTAIFTFVIKCKNSLDDCTSCGI